MGHEAAGIVEEIGKSVEGLRPGQRIAIDPALSCGKCYQCRNGREHTCSNLLFLGCPGQLEGAMTEYAVLNEKSCFPLNENTTFEQAVLSEPLAIAVYAVERSNISHKSNIAILGAGPIGMSVFHTANITGVNKVFLTDKISDRLEFSSQLGPNYRGNPDSTNIIKEITSLEPELLDIVFECSGDIDAFNQGISLLKPGGTFVIIGIPEVDNISFPIHELRRKEITIINIRRQNNCTQKAIDLLESKSINMDSMVTHHFDLNQSSEAFRLVENYEDGVMKAMITFN